jgi:hypothetical protein
MAVSRLAVDRANDSAGKPEVLYGGIVGNHNHSAKRKEVKKAAKLPEHISNAENACLD